MKTIIKSAFLALPLLAGLAFTACTNEYEYTPAPETGAQVYFNSELPRQYDVSKDATSFTIDVLRANTASAIDVPLKIEIEEGAPFSCSTEMVHFEAGEAKAPLTFEYDNTKLNYGEYYAITLAVADSALISSYGVGNYEFMAGLNPYRPMLNEDGTPALAKYRGDTFEGAFGFEYEEFDVEILEHVVTPGLYRILNPYGEHDYYKGAGNEYIDIDASDPDYVYIPGVYRTGVTVSSSYGEVSTSCYAWYYVMNGYDIATVKGAKPNFFGTLVDGIITMPKGSMFLWMGADAYGPYDNGMFRIVLPGYSAYDYSASIEYTGRYIDAKEKGQVIANITLGADAAMAKVVLAPGTDPQTGIDMILAGADGIVTVTTSGEIRLPYEAPGEYTICAVTYSKGEPKDAAYLNILIQGDGAPQETYTALYTGTYTHCAQSLTGGSAFWGAEECATDGILYSCDQDETKYKLAPWVNNEMTFFFYEDGSIVVPENYTGWDSQYGEIYGADVKTHGAADITSCQDEETGLLCFYLSWYCEAGNFAHTLDTYQLTGYASAPAKARARKNLQLNLKPNVSLDLDSKPATASRKVSKSAKRFKDVSIITK